MDAQVDIAICLRQWEFSETSQTAVLFGRNLGLVRVLGKGTKRADPRFSGGLEIGTMGEAVVIPKASGGLVTLAGWDLKETFRSGRSDLKGYYASMLALEVTLNLLPEGEPHSPAFDALVAALSRPATRPWPPVIAEFLWAMISEAGFRPQVEGHSDQVVGFAPNLGELIPVDAVPGPHLVWQIQPTTVRALRELAQTGSAAHLTEQEAERVGRLLAWYIREITEKELTTLRPLFGEVVPKSANSGQ
ncbi:MAG TPA: hypothetical protein ENJ00_03370 [Phycisphaerales bacterium]|nr:hypothetical protein [Phycisphaerales bacterium]